MNPRRLFRVGSLGAAMFVVPLALALEDTQVGSTGASGQPGGNATAVAAGGDAINRATARGGEGGGLPQGGSQNAGGVASATADSDVPTTSIAGRAEATANGGSGGAGGSFSNGASGWGGQALATAHVQGGATGSALSAIARAVGGIGGICYDWGNSGRAGDARASAAGQSTSAATLDVTAEATGGFGGQGNQNGFVIAGGAGGAAYATAAGILNTAGLLRVQATARGGAGTNGVVGYIPNGGAADGGAGGGVSFGEVSGVSLGDAIVTATGVGGNSGSGNSRGGYAASSPAGRSVTLNNVVSGSAPGLLQLEQLAQGGTGSGLGGSATSSLDRTAAGGAREFVLISRAIGGQGYFSGAATSLARAVNPTGQSRATALSTGGFLSPNGFFGGNGGRAQATAEATGSTHAEALARADGGGGAANFSTGLYDSGGVGGTANAQSSAQSIGSGDVSSSAVANGGGGGNSPHDTAGVGGGATATATGTALGGALNVSALARAGDGGNMTSNLTIFPTPHDGSAGSNAAASAAGSTGGSGTFFADAFAGRNGLALGAAHLSSTLGTASASVDATAAAGTLRATAATGTRGLLVTDVTAAANGTFSARARAQAQASVAATAPLANTADGFTATAFGTGAPLAADVAAFVAGNPNAKYSLSGITTSRALLLGTLGATHTSGSTPQTMTLSLGVSVDLALLPPADRAQLTLALANPLSGGFQSLALNVTVEGIAVLAATFADPAGATAYFTDHVLDLGPLGAGVSGTLDVQVSLTVVTVQTGDSFRAEFLVANGAAVPEPRVWALFAAAVVVAVQLRRRR